jgi:hypothetical protein
MSSRHVRPFARLFAAKAQHRWRFVSAENAPRYATIAERRGDAGVMRPNLLGIVGMTSARCSGDRGSKQLRTNSRLSPMLASKENSSKQFLFFEHKMYLESASTWRPKTYRALTLS